MGLSSSQARLLTLTGRMHDIEYKAARLEAQKLQMANESSRVYNEYLNALDATKIQYQTIGTDGSLDYVDATYASMIDNGYIVKFKGDDRISVSQATADNYDEANGNRNYFIALQTGRVTADDQTVDGVVEIYTADQLKNMTTGKSYRLMNNIDLTGQSWTSKTLSRGCTFDGNGYTISGLTTALFSSIYGTVTNLNVVGNSTSKAILANYAYSNATVSNVTVSGSVNSTSSNVGALIGSASGSNITIENCSADATVYSTGNYVGGLIGYASGTSSSDITITNCSSSGNVTGYAYVGGLVGSLNYSTVSDCSSSATVYATAGDLTQYGTDTVAGGFAGNIYESTVNSCEATGDVSSNGGVIGGFAGLVTSSTISNSNASGDVTSNVAGVFDSTSKPDGLNTAGFVAAVAGATIEYCNAYGTVYCEDISQTSCAGFICGDMSGNDSAYTDTITNCYSADDSVVFVRDTSSIDAITQSTTANSNSISVSSPTVATTTTLTDTGNYGTLFDSIQEYGYIIEGTEGNPVTGHENDTTWFTNMLNEGYLYIYKSNSSTGEYEQTSVATDTGLREVSDESGLKKAEAKYEADMKKIDRKDTKYDTDLAALETERSALKEEIETLKTVANDNVERTFKLFS